MRLSNFPVIVIFTFWILFTCKIQDPRYLRVFSVVIIIPLLFLLEVWAAYLFIIGQNLPKEGLDRVDNFMISLFTIHTYFLIQDSKENKSANKNSFEVQIDLMKKKYKVQVRKHDRLFFKLEYLAYNYQKIGLYLICCCSIAMGLFEATVFDLGLVILSVRLLMKSTVFRGEWLRYILYLDALIIIK